MSIAQTETGEPGAGDHGDRRPGARADRRSDAPLAPGHPHALPGGRSGGKRPNDRLASWFARTGWSKGELARQVNRRARRLGALHVSTDTSRVRRWLDGEQPRDPIPRIISELFSEQFGCVVAVEDLGFKDPGALFTGSGVDLPWAPEPVVELLGEFSRSDLMLGRRGLLGGSLALSAGPALVEPMQRWLAPTPVPTLPTRVGPRAPGRLGLGELEQLEATVRLFRDWDMQSGGGLRRKAVVGQLQEVTDVLMDVYAGPPRERLFRLTAELALLAGWMSYDVGMQAGAQKYFVLALHAAKEAGDRPLGANVLGVMSRQMIHLDRPGDALELIHLAQYGARDSAGPRAQAMLYAVEGRAHAGLGHADRCRRAFALAEQLHADAAAAGGEEPDWIRYFGEAELCGEAGHAYRDLAYRGAGPAARAREPLEKAVRLFDGTSAYQRTLALCLVGLASVHVLEREADPACDAALGALDFAGRVRSERLATRLRRTVRNAVDAFGEDARVRALADRVVGELPETAATPVWPTS
ncbi:hypothetical protein LO772_11320 [Yinghuangia sp. ASG 101]|uniref:hypothetical protein n=1 Tax=Yinghuangia sp. ASG 101 TaxID=2896848 RepID=UPI001E5F184F|nr:hypothetical protein [Yinghuangia sp. ASG 101]UGQ14128.1 hypothetical protein LO772_11320 [Yinghuangia sp. ASG 101]